MAVGTHGLWAQRYTRIGIAGIGLLFTFTYIQFSERSSSGGFGFGATLLGDEVTMGLGITAAAVLIVVLASLTRIADRQGWPLRESRWNHPAALLLGVALYGIGTGLFTAWWIEMEGDEGCAALPIVFGLLVIALAVSERRALALPVLSQVLAAVLACIAGLIRLNVGDVRSRGSDELFVTILVTLPCMVALYFLLWGFLQAHHRGRGGVHDATGLLATPALPLTLLRADAGYVLEVEAPGLRDTIGIEARVEGSRVHVSIPRSMSDPDQVLFSSRAVGHLRFDVQLPEPVRTVPADMRIEHGIISIPLVPAQDGGGES